MSIFHCLKLEPQPWAGYIDQNKILFNGNCCSSLVTNKAALLPFQIISSGDYIKAEISPYGEDNWSEITLTIDTVIAEGYFIHSYDGSDLAEELDCGMYDFKVTAGELWYFEPIMVEDFTIDTNAFTKRDLLMTPLKFSENQIDGIPIIAPCDSFLPFMFATENATSGTVTVWLFDEDCNETELEDFDITVIEVGGMTYYIYEGPCLEELLECGLYKLEIEDGDNSYYSVWFQVECDISDIPDGSRVLRDYNGCVIRDEEGVIQYETCQPFIDWFLPASDALDEMRALHVLGYGGFGAGVYWSSTEIDADTAYTMRFSDGFDDASDKSDGAISVRAIRTFETWDTYVVGDVGPAGGVIFYVDIGGGDLGGDQVGEVAPVGTETVMYWSNIDDTEIGVVAQNTLIGSGVANCNAIIAQIGHTNSAAKYCLDLKIYKE